MLPEQAAQKLKKSLKDRGLIRTLARVPGSAGERLFSRIFHRRLNPPLRFLANGSRSTHLSPDELLLRHFVTNGESELELFRTEFAGLREELERRRKSGGLAFPEKLALGEASALVLYVAVRTLRPTTVLETGVANGVSSYFCLNALRKNGSAALHSVDVLPGVGGLLNAEERALWHLTINQGVRLRAGFAEVVRKLPAIDLFIQDSDHTYPWQMFELETVLPKMSPRSLIFADDVDSSYAFLDFASKVNSRPVFLVEAKKVVGLIFLDDDKKGRRL